MASSRPPFAPAFLPVGDLVLDTGAHALIGPSGTVDLHVGTYGVLRCLMARPGTVLEIGQIIAELWPDPDFEPDRSEQNIRMRVLRARAAIEQAGGDKRVLRSVSKVGYRIDGPAKVVRAFTPDQDAALERLLASHPDRALVAQVAA